MVHKRNQAWSDGKRLPHPQTAKAYGWVGNLRYHQQSTDRRRLHRNDRFEVAYAGITPVHAAGASDLVLRNVNSGAFEVYDIAGNTLVGAASLGAVGLDRQLGGFAVDPSTDNSGEIGPLVQAMAGFGPVKRATLGEHMARQKFQGNFFDSSQS
jgi:hypothetical protein